jgi:hypothetical protein
MDSGLSRDYGYGTLHLVVDNAAVALNHDIKTL